MVSVGARWAIGPPVGADMKPIPEWSGGLDFEVNPGGHTQDPASGALAQVYLWRWQLCLLATAIVKDK